MSASDPIDQIGQINRAIRVSGHPDPCQNQLDFSVEILKAAEQDWRDWADRKEDIYEELADEKF